MPLDVIQWKEAIHWYLKWLQFAVASGAEVRTLEERIYQAMDRAGCRQGLLSFSLRDRQ